ncbi:SecY-interacting protein [Enterobacillus tribolii]|uniref:Protein Syd n=1 Tax=Enterobacillus tribolii TaxID=1487935 RepID=A0A370QPR0_9GAMM|nr:SecY-interacting protein [Enterobacillus tribolii]MBW7981401.1 SecY-interacting protein [Enterobacillus tribolii]RDK90776.1 SecY interacting protein Syd [Enterobacillus tribolii]
MMHEVSAALTAFTGRFIAASQQECGDYPASSALYGIPSPCIVRSDGERVYWQPQPVAVAENLDAVARALDIQLHPDVAPFYTSQYAADMRARFDDVLMDVVQVWSEDDFVRLQENLIGHLVTQRRLKLPPTLFLATTDSELELISLCNLSGEVLLEQFGSRQRTVIAPSLAAFLSALQPVVAC